MKSHVSLFLLFLLLAAFPVFHADASQSTDADAPASVESIACPSVNGALHVEGRQLTDEHGNAVQLKGISTHGCLKNMQITITSYTYMRSAMSQTAVPPGMT